MRTEISWTLKIVNLRTEMWALVTVRNVDLMSAAFDVNTYVSLVTNIITYQYCLVCG